MSFYMSGYGYFQTGAGQIKIPIIESTEPMPSGSWDLNGSVKAAFDAVGSPYDGSMSIYAVTTGQEGGGSPARRVYATGISMCGFTTQQGVANTLALSTGATFPPKVGQSTSFVDISVPALLHFSDGKYMFGGLAFNNGVPDSGITIPVPGSSWGYFVGVTPTATYASGFQNIYYSSAISDYVNQNPPTSNPVTNDPYEPGGESAPGGGTGAFSDTGDDIDIPNLPTLSAVDTGFITLFNPSTAQLHSLANYMWSSGFDLDTFKKLFADPMDCILGLSIVPVEVPNGGASTVNVGNISTGVTMTKAGSQYVSVDCGTLNIQEYWGAYLDYDPYTKAEIYLPYIGTHALAVDDIMGKPVHVVYHVDILSGACAAYIKCGGSVLYTFIGQCSSSIPITENDWTNVINGVLTAAGAIGSMVATGGASAPLAIPALASTAVNSMKPTVEKSGSMSGTGGMLGVQTPYIILTRPRQALPAKQHDFSGYPSFITRKLKDLSGYTEIDSIHLESIPATEHELSEIENLLKSGVIL